MYCTNCGTQHGETDKHCRECGQQTPAGRDARRQNTSAYDGPQRLYRVMSGKKIAGVCSGFAQYLDVDVTLVRLTAVAGAIFSCGMFLLAYIVAWIIMPSDRHVPPFRSAASTPTQTAI